MKVLFCWSRLCLVLGSPVPVCSLVSVCSSVRVPPFAPIPPQLPLSPHPGIQGHRGRGDTGPLAQDTGYKGYFYSWFARYWWPKKEKIGSLACRIKHYALIYFIPISYFSYMTGCAARGRQGSFGKEGRRNEIERGSLQKLLSHPLIFFYPEHWLFPPVQLTVLNSLILFEGGTVVPASLFQSHLLMLCPRKIASLAPTFDIFSNNFTIKGIKANYDREIKFALKGSTATSSHSIVNVPWTPLSSFSVNIAHIRVHLYQQGLVSLVFWNLL